MTLVDSPTPAEDDRLAGDLELVRELQRAGADDELWIETRKALGRYALPYLVVTARDGRLHGTAARLLGRHMRPTLERIPAVKLDPHSALWLAVVMIWRAHQRFSTTSVTDWSPAKGPLSDYFVGCCLLQFVGAYRALWGLGPVDEDDYISGEPEGTASRGRPHDPGEVVINQLVNHETISELLHAEGADVVEMAALVATGWSVTDASKTSGVSRARWYRRLAKWRKHLQEKRTSDG